jgi:hypothetical protein
MKVQIVDAVDAIVFAPLLAGAVGTRHHQPMQDGEEDGALDGKLELAVGEQVVQNFAALGIAPQPLE